MTESAPIRYNHLCLQKVRIALSVSAKPCIAYLMRLVPICRGLLLLTCIFLATSMSGCIFDPPRGKTKPPDPPAQYYVRSTPEFVLLNYQTAYNNRDSAQYDSLYDDVYEGTSRDPASGVLSTFHKRDEADHIAALAKSPTVASVRLVFGASLRFTDLSDPPGYATLTVQDTHLDLNVTEGTSYSLIGNDIMVFKFKPRTPDPTSTTDTTWQIIGWTEGL